MMSVTKIVRARWISYGFCFLVGGMRNQNQRTYEKNKILKILWRWSWRNVKIKMDIKEEVLSRKVQDLWRFSKTDCEVCHGKLRSQHTFRTYDEYAFRAKWINIKSKKNTSLTSSRWWSCIFSQMDQYQIQEEYITHILERMKLANPNRSRFIPSQRG